MLGIGFIDLTVYDGLASKRNSDSDSSPDQRLLSTDFVDHEDDEDKIWIQYQY